MLQIGGPSGVMYPIVSAMISVGLHPFPSVELVEDLEQLEEDLEQLVV
jgi:hypothetical protein